MKSWDNRRKVCIIMLFQRNFSEHLVLAIDKNKIKKLIETIMFYSCTFTTLWMKLHMKNAP